MRNPVKEAQTRVVIVGMAGSGKTWYAFEKFFFAVPKGWGPYSRASSLRECNVFFDTNNSSADPNTFEMIRAYTNVFNKDVIITHTVEEFTKAFEAGLHHIIVAPGLTESTESFKERVYEVTLLIQTYQASVPGKYREPCYLYYDEISALCPKMQESIVSQVYTRGRILKMLPIGISQRPQMVPRYCYDESSYDIVFKLRTEHYHALKRSYGMDCPVDVQAELANVKYLYYIYDGHTWTRGSVKEVK